MKVIGLTGGIGTGKSTVAHMLRDLGWTVLSSDETAREIMNTDTDVREAVAKLFGPEVLVPGGLDRGHIAGLVFGASADHKARLDALDKIVHPRVLDAHMIRLEELAEGGCPLTAIESALLYEVGLDDAFDYVILVDATDELRIQRVMERSGLTREQVKSRMDEQLPMAEKRSFADFVIDNSGTLEELANTVRKVATIVQLLPESDNMDDVDAS